MAVLLFQKSFTYRPLQALDADAGLQSYPFEWKTTLNGFTLNLVLGFTLDCQQLSFLGF